MCWFSAGLVNWTKNMAARTKNWLWRHSCASEKWHIGPLWPEYIIPKIYNMPIICKIKYCVDCFSCLHSLATRGKLVIFWHFFTLVAKICNAEYYFLYAAIVLIKLVILMYIYHRFMIFWFLKFVCLDSWKPSQKVNVYLYIHSSWNKSWPKVVFHMFIY